jgi:hypothetical protein
MAPRSVVVHGHFYQPPRENPWLGYVEAEANAAPQHDWNRRVEQECYRAVAAARIPDAVGRIARIVNTLERISFDFGPTLLDWMEEEAPATYGAVLDADRRSRQRLGFGNAIAAPYHHVILPLASPRDKVTEVRWGIADFRRRFGRDPEGMWLPETAVDEETLEVLAAHGIRFTILAPHQVKRVPADGLPGRYRARGGRDLALFIYDGPLSHDVAFGQLLQDAFAWAERLLGLGGGALVSMATDGETFGHHHRFGEMALARVLEILDQRSDAAVTNYAAFLAAHPPMEAVELVAPSAWSCPHGVERWRSDCGCRVAPEKNWNQRWRAPLRAATEWLAGALHRTFETEGGGLLRDPWAARDAYATARAAGSDAVAAFVAAQAAHALTAEQTVRARELLEMEWDANALFTSCAWFFDDVGGLEPLQLMRYAAHAIALSGAGWKELEAGFADRLLAAVSNDPAVGDGRRVFLERARPHIDPAAQVAASYAALRRFAPAAAAARLYDFDVSGDGDRVRLVHRRTGSPSTFEVGVRALDGWRFATSAAPSGRGAAVSLSLAELTERERESVTRALVASLARRALAPGENAALCEGRASLGEVLARALVSRVTALASDGSEAARSAVLNVLDLLELTDGGVPFDAQTAFERVRAALPAAEAHSLSAIARRLGFSAAS